MFDIGFSEMVLIGLIALIVLGPKRLPEVARSAGQWAGKLRRFVENVKRDINAEIQDEDLAAFKQMHAELNETRNLLQKSASDTFNDFSGAMHDVTQLAETTGDVDESVSVTAKLPAAPASKPLPKKSSRAPRKTSAKSVSKKIVTKKVVAKKTATKTNRTPHGRVKKT